MLLRRKSGTQGIPLDVAVRTVLRGWTPASQEGFAAEGETLAIVSATEMKARQWCWPPIPGDFLVSRDRERKVRGVNAVRLAGVLVRVELAIIGDDLGR